MQASWSPCSESGQNKRRCHNTFYLTTPPELIADLATRGQIWLADLANRYQGILVYSAKDSNKQKELLFSLLSLGTSKGQKIPCLLSKSLRVIRRVLEAQRSNDGASVIAEAYANGRVLAVRDANLDLHVFAADRHPILKHLSEERLASFRIDAAGSGLHWPELDLDLDLDGLHARPEEPSGLHRLQRYRALMHWLQRHQERFESLHFYQREKIFSLLESLASSCKVLTSQDILNLQPLTDQTPEDILNEIAEIQRMEQKDAALNQI